MIRDDFPRTGAEVDRGGEGKAVQGGHGREVVDDNTYRIVTVGRCRASGGPGPK
jgi:hypothetical protein